MLGKIKEAYKQGAIEAKMSKRIEEYFDLEDLMGSEELLLKRIDKYIDKHIDILIKNEKNNFLERIAYEIGCIIEFNTINFMPFFCNRKYNYHN